MLEKPELQDENILSCVQANYGLASAFLTFLPLGADVNTAAYQLVSEDGKHFFLKLRRGNFTEISVNVPVFLKKQDIQPIITPLETRTGRYWATLEAYKMILYPFVEGKDGYEVKLTEHQWQDFGMALKNIHSVHLPLALEKQIPREKFSPLWREMVKAFQVQVEGLSFVDPVAAKLAAFMRGKRAEIAHLVERANQLALLLQSRSLEKVLCHSDIHPGNLLITNAGDLYIVDWDNPVLAPKEHDLMHLGGSTVWTPAQAAMFYQGYGLGDNDPVALAYYRYERIIQDIAEFCKQLLLTDKGGKNRLQSLRWFTGQFLPGHEVEIANRTDLQD